MFSTVHVSEICQENNYFMLFDLLNSKLISETPNSQNSEKRLRGRISNKHTWYIFLTCQVRVWYSTFPWIIKKKGNARCLETYTKWFWYTMWEKRMETPENLRGLVIRKFVKVWSLVTFNSESTGDLSLDLWPHL